MVDMKIQSTGRDAQRTAFVESLYNSLRKKTEAALEDHKKIISVASSYIQDGLEPNECAELLMIDYGISRDAAESYVSMIKNAEVEENSLQEFSFQFEDVNGRVWSSFDIGKIVKASSDKEAWEKAEEIMFSETSIEPEKVLNVNRI